MKSPAFLSADHVFRSDSTSKNSLELRTMSWNRDWCSGAWSGSSWKTSGSSGWNNRDWQQARTCSDAPPSDVLHRADFDFKVFCDPHFYDGILLETVSDHQWLGFTIDAKARKAVFNLLTKPWQIRFSASAGSWKLCASSYFSRASLIRQYSWPQEAAPEQIQELTRLYVKFGYPPEVFK